MNHCHLDHGLTRPRQSLVILAEAMVSTQPTERPLDHPTLRQELEALLLVTPLDDRQLPATFRPHPVDQPPLLINPVRPHHLQPGTTILDGPQHRLGPV